MKRMLRSAGALLVCSALLTPAAQAYYTVTANGTAPATYSAAPQTAMFYKPTGDYFVGTALTATGPTYTLNYFNYRNSPNAAPAATALGTDASISGLAVGKLTVCPYSGSSTGITTPTIVAYMTVANTLNAVTKANQTASVTTPVKDAAGAATAGVQALTSGTLPGTTTDAIFATVLANAGTNFGEANSGVAGGLLTQSAAGAANVQLYNVTTGAAAATNGGVALAANFGAALGVNNNWFRSAASTTVAAAADIWYDPLIGTSNGGTLYVAAQNTTTATVGLNTQAFGLGIYHVTPTAASFVLTQTGIITDATNDVTRMILASVTNSATTVSLLKVRTMHTSTGLAYVIFNGGNGAANTVGNKVSAIPVVNGTGTAADGLPAKVTSFTNGQYTVAAAALADLYASTTIAVQVGNGLLPTAATTAASDMYVDGDTVYVSIDIAPDPTNQPGIYSSHAVFNSLGQIDHWTDWRKVIPNDMGNSATGSNGSVTFGAVDSYTGHVLAIENNAAVAKVTQWTQPTGTPSSQPLLAAAVNSALSNACYSVFDLNSSTTGWGHTVVQRITAFGGQEKVCFAVTGSSSSADNAAVIALTTSTGIDAAAAIDTFYAYDNSTANVMFVTTSLPSGAGAVVSLGYSSWDADNTTGTTATSGFFLAGCAGTASTAPALYVFADPTTGAGVNPRSFTGLGNVYTNYTWQKVTNVSGMPVKIMSNGGGLHVLTRTATLDRIYSASKQTTLSGLNNSFIVTASSGAVPIAGSTASSLASVKQIYDFVISVSATASNTAIAQPTEQIMMLTNDGIYTTSSLLGMQAVTSATTGLNQLTAGWAKIDATSSVVTNGFFTDYMAQPNYNRNPQTFWFANFAPDAANTSVYNRNIEYQMSRQSFLANNVIGALANALTYSEDPSNTATYNIAQSFNQTTAPTIYKTFPVTARLFYSDGARRFFIQKNPSDDTKYQVLALPYNAYDYNITANGKSPMPDTVVAQAGSFYWCREIGSTGRLMMGTSNGVISLQ